jgi:hypothetical protein
MEPENTAVKSTSRLNQVTPLSKYLAMVLFIAMPFIGGWIGYQYAMGEAALEMRDENLFNKNDFVNIEKGTTLKVENDSFDKNSKTKNFRTNRQ